MEHVANEKVTYHSTVNVAWNTLSVPGITGLTSKECGLGWTFRLVKPEPLYVNSLGEHVALQLVLEPKWFTTFSDHISINRIHCDISWPDSSHLRIDKETSSTDAVILISPLKYHKTLHSDSDNVILNFTVELGPRNVIKTSVPTLPATAAAALANTIHSGDLIDSKFFLYSKHGKHGGAKEPKALFASSAILHKFACEDLNLLLSADGFEGSEDVLIDLVEPPHDQAEADSSIYGYDSDSDLEDDEEITLIPSVLALDGEKPGAQLPSPQAEEKLETSKGKTDDSENLSHKLLEMQKSTSSKFIRTGRQVFVRDTAFRTWSALLHYIYFEKVVFAKLKSTYTSPVEATSRFDQPFACSPKSMYRLADKLGINKLKTLALKSIKTQLNGRNISQEAFCRFTARYPDILNMEITLLCEDYCTDTVEERISEAMDDFGAGSTYLGGALKGIMSGLVKDHRANSYARPISPQPASRPSTPKDIYQESSPEVAPQVSHQRTTLTGRRGGRVGRG